MSVISMRAAFLWMVFALLLSTYVILNEFAHLYGVPYWNVKWINMIMGFLLQYAWKIGFVIGIIAVGLFLFLVISHMVYYTKKCINRVKGVEKPLTDKEIMLSILTRLNTLIELQKQHMGISGNEPTTKNE